MVDHWWCIGGVLGQPFLLMISSIFSIKNITPGMMVRNQLDDQAMSKLLMKSTHNKKVLEAHKIVLEAHKSFRFSSIYLFCGTCLYPFKCNEIAKELKAFYSAHLQCV